MKTTLAGVMIMTNNKIIITTTTSSNRNLLIMVKILFQELKVLRRI
jgi:hypothetical protein